MNWQAQVQLRDLDPAVRLELTCRQCGTVRFVTVADLMGMGDFGRLWLDEVQARAKCQKRGCASAMRLAMPHNGKTKGFVGGIA